MHERDWDEAWLLTDEVLRLAQVQAWLWPQRHDPALAGEDLDELAAAVCDEGPAHPFWDDFAEIALETYHQTWREFDLARWTVADLTHFVGPDLEVVVFTREPPAEIGGIDPSLVMARPFLMRFTGAGWLVAHAGSNRLPVPGWPPEFPDTAW